MARASLPGRAGGAGQAALPAVWEEFEGLAEGLDMPLADALLWNCRGDLLHKTTDGCTSAALKSADGTRWIGHNEDGDPYLYGRCHLVDVALDDAPGYLGFYYPGSLPGHTFGANRAGLVQTINNLRARQRHEGVPRMFLARAALDCATLDEAVQLLRATPAPGLSSHAGLGAGRQAVQRRSAARRCLYTGNRRALRPRQPHDPRRHRRPASSRHRFVARAPAPHRRHRRQLVARDRRRRVAGRAARYRGRIADPAHGPA